MDFYLQQAREAIDAATQGMSPAQMAWHPEGKWCAAEVLEHLSLAFTSTSGLLKKCLAERKASTARPSLKQRMITLVVLDIGYFPTGRQAPEWTRPKGGAPEAALPAIREHLAQMDTDITECEKRFGGGILAVHPIIGPLTPQQWRKFHWTHTRHHMKQIAGLRAGCKV